MSILIIHQNSSKVKEYIKELIINIDESYQNDYNIQKTLDVHIVESETTSIGIDEIKKLLGSLQYKPLSHEKQFGIIINAYLLTTEAQNVLLKSLEEPSQNTEFIIAARSVTDVLPTIRSRCTIHYISAEESKVKIPEECNTFIQMKPHERFLFIREYSKTHKKKEDLEQFIVGLIEIYRTKLQEDRNLSKNNGENLKILNTAYSYWQSNVNKQLLLEYIAINLAHST